MVFGLLWNVNLSTTCCSELVHSFLRIYADIKEMTSFDIKERLCRSEIPEARQILPLDFLQTPWNQPGDASGILCGEPHLFPYP